MSEKRSSTIAYLQSEDFIYCDKLRLRNIPPYLLDSRPDKIVMLYFKEVLRAGVKARDIDRCFFQVDWLNNSKNIIVVFKDLKNKNDVYKKRSFVNGGMFDLCDELDKDRRDIWKTLIRKFGEHKVVTHNGGVMLFEEGKQYHFVLNEELEIYFSNLNSKIFLLNMDSMKFPTV